MGGTRRLMIAAALVAIALAVGGLAALLGTGTVWQLVLSALTGITGTVILRRWKSTQAKEAPNASLDIGQPVRVIKWKDNGTARVFYRGAEWDAKVQEEGSDAKVPAQQRPDGSPWTGL